MSVKGWKLNITSNNKDEKVRWEIFRQFTCSCTAISKFRKKVRMKVTQSCLTLGDPMEIPHGIHTVHGILQVRILEWVAFPFSGGSSQPRDQTHVSRIAGGFFTSWATWKPKDTGVGSLSLLQDPGIELGSSALQVDSLPTELWGNSLQMELSILSVNHQERGRCDAVKEYELAVCSWRTCYNFSFWVWATI